jgi:uncharacterized protein (TIGR02001 family)
VSRFAAGAVVAIAGIFAPSFSVAGEAPKVIAPKIIAYDPTQAVADFLKTATIEMTVAREEPAYDDRVELSWGVALASNYVSSGVTQSDDKPAFQAWGEIASGIVYAGIWLSTVELDPDNWEFDLSWGIRPSFGPLTLTVGYIRYVYDSTGDCCGEWVVDAEVEVSDRLSAFAEVSFDPQAEVADGTLGFTFGLTDSLDFSLEATEGLESGEADWNAGFTWSFNDNLSLDLRYHDADFADPRYVATLAWQGSTSQ